MVYTSPVRKEGVHGVKRGHRVLGDSQQYENFVFKRRACNTSASALLHKANNKTVYELSL